MWLFGYAGDIIDSVKVYESGDKTSLESRTKNQVRALSLTRTRRFKYQTPRKCLILFHQLRSLPDYNLLYRYKITGASA